MISTRLPWRIGLPFVAFVLLGSMGLVVFMGWHLAGDEQSRFEQLARTNADFINRVRLPPTLRMADELREVLGTVVCFRHEGVLTPEPLPWVSIHVLREMPADGRLHRSGTVEGVAVRLNSGSDLILARAVGVEWRGVFHRSTFAVLGAFWLLALLVAWLITRRLVQPLRHLAARLPDIEKPGAPDLPESRRMDEIGDVARAFVRTREALQSEREQRGRAERLAVLGRMTAALAHEIQNPVAAIKIHAQLLQAKVIEDEASRVEDLVNQWMFLSKPEPPAMSAVDVGALLTTSLGAQRLQMEHAQVKFVTKLDDGLVVQGDRRRLAQVFSNLITNAIQAMPRGGVLHVAAHRTGDRVAITFADQGRGFSEEALRRFAEFFYSEKEGGMGIGLSVANEIVKAHGGELVPANRAEGGASVTVRLPVCVL